MLKVGLFITLLSFYIVAQIICNAVEDNSMMTAANVADVTSMSEGTQTTTVTSTGNTITWFDKTWDFIKRVILFDYTMFYNVDPLTGTQTANVFSAIRYLLIVVGAAAFIDFCLILRSLMPGAS